MVKFIESELDQLRREVERMWGLVYSQLEQAREAVLRSDAERARQIVVREKRVNAFELKIDSDVEDVIALYSPVAVDLRFALAMLKINSNLERIGDYADGIARFVLRSGGVAPDAKLADDLRLPEMFDTVLFMLRELQEALSEENAEKAAGVMAKDDELDRIHAASVAILADYTRRNPDRLEWSLEFLSVFRKLERTGDHLTNIAEEIVFYIDAKVLKHKNNIPDGKE